MVPLGAVHHTVIDCRFDARIAAQACRCFFVFYASLAAGGGGAWTILSPAVCRGLPARIYLQVVTLPCCRHAVAAVRARRAAGVSAYVCRRPGGRRIAFAMDGTVLASALHRVHRAQARGMQYLLRFHSRPRGVVHTVIWCIIYTPRWWH